MRIAAKESVIRLNGSESGGHFSREIELIFARLNGISATIVNANHSIV